MQEIGEHDHLRGCFSSSHNCISSIHGTVTGIIIITASSETRIYGTINGDLINNGGILKIYGMVIGKVHTLKGETHIDPRAKIYDVSTYILST
jgi:hypothetical protein